VSRVYAASTVHVDDLLRPWLDSLLADASAVAPVDCHTHLGVDDPDGFYSLEPDLLEALDRLDAAAFVFPMHEPAGYREPNRRVRAAAERSSGSLTPFCRLDPADEPVDELRRSLEAGACGLKLHPRAERFRLDDTRLEAAFEEAAQRRVPVLVHAGRGIPALGRDALALTERFPAMPLILAHAGVSDLSWIWRHAPDHPNLLFDTAWWTPADLIALFALVPPGQVLFGSDAPYGTPLQSAIGALRSAHQVGLRSRQIDSVMGGQARRLLAGQPPLDMGPAPGSERLSRDVILERVHAVLIAGVRRTLHGEDAAQERALATLACQVEAGAPQEEVCGSILALLALVEGELEGRRGAEAQHPSALALVTAATIALTPDVPVPDRSAETPVAATLPRSDESDGALPSRPPTG
jgi:predicted TIM-barrel fold metal-dependent hydrolase